MYIIMTDDLSIYLSIYSSIHLFIYSSVFNCSLSKLFLSAYFCIHSTESGKAVATYSATITPTFLLYTSTLSTLYSLYTTLYTKWPVKTPSSKPAQMSRYSPSLSTRRRKKKKLIKKLHSNRLKKEAARADTTFKSEKAKADKAMKNREFQIARIHASSAVREKRRQVTLRSEAARADVIINELKAAQSTRDTSRTLALASRGLDAASKSVNLEHLVSHANNFLARSEDFRIASSAIDDVAQGVSMQEAGAEGEADVDKLMEQLADDAGVDMRVALDADTAPTEEVKEQQGQQQGQQQQQPDVEDGLGARLRALRAAN